jgi:hypothetical protein
MNTPMQRLVFVTCKNFMSLPLSEERKKEKSIPEIDVLQRHFQLFCLEHLDHFLRVVAFFAGHAHLVALDGGLDFQFFVFNSTLLNHIQMIGLQGFC